MNKAIDHLSSLSPATKLAYQCVFMLSLCYALQISADSYK